MLTLTKIEKKMTAKFVYPITRIQDCGNAGFILSDGLIIATTDHAALCKKIGHSLQTVIRSGVCRFMFREGKEGKIAAFEYTNLTTKQKTTICKLLKNDDYFCVVTTKTTVSRFRPIRSIRF